ncbi:hypothetical protein Tco_0002250 [Tanacetum coccineum]
MKNDIKSKSILMMALPNEHLLTFNQYKDAKSLFAAIEARFGGNEATKKTQKTLLNINNVDTTNVHVSTAISDSTQDSTASLKQIHEDDLEEMDLEWQLALLSMRARRKTVNEEETTPKAMIAIDGAGFDWSFMADEEVPTNMNLMAFLDLEFNKTEFDLANYKRGLTSVEEQLVFYKKNEVMFTNQIAVLKRDASCKDSDIIALKTVLTKSGKVPIRTARQSSSREATPVSTARPIHTTAPKPLVNVAKPRSNAFQMSPSLSMRPFYQQTTLKNRNLNNRVNTAKIISVNTARGKRVTSAIGEQRIDAIKSSSY